MNEPRQFWLLKTWSMPWEVRNEPTVTHHELTKQIHVIEYSAYEELKKRLDEVEERLYHITGSYE